MASQENRDAGPVGHALRVERLVGASTPAEREDLLHILSEIARATPEFHRAEPRGEVVLRQDPDGIVLVFLNNAVAAVQCAADISRIARARGLTDLRMGLHTGPVTHQEESTVAEARAIAAWGDAGHILLSPDTTARVRTFDVWANCLHDLGPTPLSEDLTIHLWNLHMGQVGNGAVPSRLQAIRPTPPTTEAASPSLARGASVPVPLPADVFLSHSSVDKAVADALVNELETNGIRCWIAPRDIPPGVDWSAAIIGALNRCRVLVLVFSERANVSPQVIREVERAVSKRATVLTFRIENVPLSEQMEYFISASHWMDATQGWQAQVPAIVPAVQALLNAPATSRIHLGAVPGNGGAADAAAPTPPPSTANALHLPLVPTALFGRDDEVEDVLGLLEAQTRLLTLTGFGGVGKTRVALEVARQAAPQYPGGVWWMDLSEVRTEDAMFQHIGLGLDLRLTPPPPAREQILGYLRDRQKTLLVLDNVEQIAGVENALRDLLAAAPSLTLMITSRRTMGLRSETVREIRPLHPHEALDLFVERARAVRDDFELTDDNREDVETLVTSLEGVPLAVELAAARVVGMTPRQMVTRLSERFRLLQTRAPDLPERQRALRAAIDWSYALLTEEDRSLFAQISVFASGKEGFRLEDVEAVCDVFDPFEGILTLRNHSLLVADTDEETQENRYRLLESLRAYACDKLATDFPQLDRQARERHARYYLQFAESRLALLRTAREAEALDQMEGALDNLRTAMEWAASVGAEVSDLHARLALSLGILFQRWGFQAQAVEPIEAGLAAARPAASATPQILLRLLCERAGLHLDLKEPDQARQRAAEALALAKDLGDTVGEAGAENLLGQADMNTGDYAGAREHYLRALQLHSDRRDQALAAIVHNNLGLVELQDPAGDRQKAREHLEEALRIRQAGHDERGLATVVNNLGHLAFEEQDWARAEQAFLEAARYESDVHHTFGVARALNNLAESVEARGQVSPAVPLYAAAEMLFRDVKHANAEYSGGRLVVAAEAAGVPEAELSRIRHSLRGKRLGELAQWAHDLVRGNAGTA